MSDGTSAWFQALFVAPPRICGVQLRPYSIGHERILIEIGSPYATGEEPTDSDLLAAIQICGRTLAGCQQLIAGGPTRRLRRWGVRWTRYGLATAHKSFRTYLDDYLRAPAHEKTGNETPCNADVYWHYARILCDCYGFDFFADPRNPANSAWDCPKPVAVCCADAWGESQGVKGLVSDADERIADTVVEGQKALAEGRTEEATALFQKAQVMANRLRGA